MFSFHPFIDKSISLIAPGYRALSILVKGNCCLENNYSQIVLQDACSHILENDYPWAESHLDAWGAVFRQFGAKPNRTPCSATALRKRVFKDGEVPSINPIVDIYNAISIKYAIPIGGESIDAYQGNPKLTISNGLEVFDTLRNGALVQEKPDAGEVIWRDDVGVTCRRWNWRQGVRTKIGSDTRNMWFILESLPEIPREYLHKAGEEMVSHLQCIMPGSSIEINVLSA
ncbi:TPA: B3/B4 domain-containing protein [Photobacterium damselae]